MTILQSHANQPGATDAGTANVGPGTLALLDCGLDEGIARWASHLLRFLAVEDVGLLVYHRGRTGGHHSWTFKMCFKSFGSNITCVMLNNNTVLLYEQ